MRVAVSPDASHVGARVVQVALAAFLAGMAVHVFAAGTVPGTHFEYGDWEISCDNTKTCRAAGYQPWPVDDEHPTRPVSVLLTRAAGPATPLSGEVQLGGSGDPLPPTTLWLEIDDRRIGRQVATKEGIGHLDEAQATALAHAAVGSGQIRFVSGADEGWTLSGSGAAAVLLKMDDLQGRIGTPSALARRGTADEARVLPPVAPPVIQAVAFGQPRHGDQALARRVLATVHLADQCDLAKDPDGGSDMAALVQVRRLGKHLLLVGMPCWRGAYNEADAWWVAADAPPYAARHVADNANDLQPTLGQLTFTMKGRGIGDCMSIDEWTWDGRDFVQTKSTTTGMCKDFAGGAWDLPMLVSKVMPPR